MESKEKNKVWLRLPNTANESFQRVCAPGGMQSQMERGEQRATEREIDSKSGESEKEREREERVERSHR